MTLSLRVAAIIPHRCRLSNPSTTSKLHRASEDRESPAAGFAVALHGDRDELCSGANVVAQVVGSAEDHDGYSLVITELLDHQVFAFLDVRFGNFSQYAGGVERLSESQTFVCVQRVNFDLPLYEKSGGGSDADRVRTFVQTISRGGMADVNEGSFELRNQAFDPYVSMPRIGHRVQKQFLLILHRLDFASENHVLIFDLVRTNLIFNVGFEFCVLDEMPIEDMDDRQRWLFTINCDFHGLNARKGFDVRQIKKHGGQQEFEHP